MSGHSKWHNIQIRKGKQDAKKADVFTKCAKLITVAAERGADPAMNFALRLAVDKAKAAGMPKDNIERAIKRGSGELSGVRMAEVFYEGFGPGGVAVLVKALTDNKNRTVSDLKHIFSVNGGSLGGAGSVQWMFEQWGMVKVKGEGVKEKEDSQLMLIETGAEDFIDTEDGDIDIKVKIENLQKVEQKAKELGLEIKDSKIHWIAKDRLELPKEHEDKLAELFTELEAHDDVEDYYTNAE